MATDTSIPSRSNKKLPYTWGKDVEIREETSTKPINYQWFSCWLNKIRINKGLLFRLSIFLFPVGARIRPPSWEDGLGLSHFYRICYRPNALFWHRMMRFQLHLKNTRKLPGDLSWATRRFYRMDQRLLRIELPPEFKARHEPLVRLSLQGKLKPERHDGGRSLQRDKIAIRKYFKGRYHVGH